MKKRKGFGTLLKLAAVGVLSGVLLTMTGCDPASSNLLVDGSNMKLEFNINSVKDPGPQKLFNAKTALPEGVTFEEATELFYPGEELREEHWATGIAFIPASLPEDGEIYTQLFFDGGGGTDFYQDGKWTGTVQDCYRLAYMYEDDGESSYNAAYDILRMTTAKKCVGNVSEEFAAPADDTLNKQIADAKRILDALGYENYEIDIARKYTREGLSKLAKCTHTVYSYGVGDLNFLPEATYWIRVKLNGTVSGHDSHTRIDFLYSADRLYTMEAQAQIVQYEVVDTVTMCSPQEALKAVSAALSTSEVTLYDVYVMPYYMGPDEPANYEPYWCFVFRDKKENVEIDDEDTGEIITYEFDCWQFNYMYVNAKGEVKKFHNTVLFGGGLYPITEYNK
ncbi:MAG: hypothetical protein IJY28_02980 [Clostridia bacterium]|nr:hypothetical protein [Clostridia bacterium]